MTFTVYGIRLIGTNEARYIGFTKFTPQERLQRHSIDSTYGTPGRPLRQWLIANRGMVEAFAIGEMETEAAARTMEKVVIALCLRLGQRLFNSDHVPARLRLVA